MALKHWLGVVELPLAGDDRYRNTLAIPYLTANGVKAIRFRDLTGTRPGKYAQPAGQKLRLYNTAAYFDAEDVIGLTEGEIDAIVATEFLALPTMGIPGAEAWTSKRHLWKPIFKDFRAVVLFADGDSAGRELAKDVGDSLGWRLRVIDMPDGMDVSAVVANGGAHELERQWREATGR